MKTTSNNRKMALAAVRKVGLPMEKAIFSDRPYKMPKHYLKWQDWCAEAALLMDSAVQQDTASQLHRWRSLLWLSKNAPLYCVSADLIHQFEQTDLPQTPGNTLMQGMELPIDTALFAFPQGLLKNPDGGYVDMVSFHISDLNNPENSRGEYRGTTIPGLSHEHGDRINIQWSAIDSRTTVWFSGLGMDVNGSLLKRERTNLGGNQMSSADSEFTGRITNLIVQCWLAACFQPELLESEKSTKSTGGKGFGKSKKKETWSPRFLRLPEKAGKSGVQNVSHASPHAHWRRGHWRNQAVGEGRQKRKLVWVRPCYINPE